MWTQEKVNTKSITLEVFSMNGWKKFSADELAEIKANPYVKSATINMIRFTIAFKYGLLQLMNVMFGI